MAILNRFQLLEINVISAQDLKVTSRKMKTYATARVNPTRKLTGSIDTEGHNNPTWNEKFVFKVDEEFLRQDTSSVIIEIYAVHLLRDSIVGSVNVLVGNLIPPPTRPYHQNNNSGMRFVALQVRRPSGRPQGILNIGVALLDSSMRSMPLYSQMSASAVGYRDLMDEDHLQSNHNQNNNNDNNNNDDKEKKINPPVVKPILRRSKSERSERVTFENTSVANTSIIAVGQKKAHLTRGSSVLSMSDNGSPFMKKTTKASSVISGAELRENPNQSKGKKGKSGSVLSDSVVSKDSMASRYFKFEVKPKEKEVNHGKKKEAPAPAPEPVPEPVPEPEVPVKKYARRPAVVAEPPPPPPPVKKYGRRPAVIAEPPPPPPPVKKYARRPAVVAEPPPPPPPVKEKPTKVTGRPAQKFIPYDFGAPKGNQKYVHGAPLMKPSSSIFSDSEVGPSPSEVAAAMVEKRYPLDDGQSSVLDGWSLDESVEGLRSKLDRWRTELPPIYDRGLSSSYQSSVQQRPRRHSDGGSRSRSFSCFGNFFGYECQCVCGQPSGKKKYSRYRNSPSVGSRSFL